MAEELRAYRAEVDEQAAEDVRILAQMDDWRDRLHFKRRPWQEEMIVRYEWSWEEDNRQRRGVRA